MAGAFSIIKTGKLTFRVQDVVNTCQCVLQMVLRHAVLRLRQGGSDLVA